MEKTMLTRVVAPQEWLIARKQLLAKEKEIIRLRDELTVERQAMPWVKLDVQYVFDGPKGKITLADLFANRSQLVIAHFMFAPGWAEGCVGCSFGADVVDGMLPHLEHHDVSYAAISRAPVLQIEAFKKRMGWRFNWVSSYNNSFNRDFHVSFTEEEITNGEVYYNYGMQKSGSTELPGISVFYMDGKGDIFHTYSVYGRGGEELVGTYMCLDLTPQGRHESGFNGDMQDWVRHHDKYEDVGVLSIPVTVEETSCCHPAKEAVE